MKTIEELLEQYKKEYSEYEKMYKNWNTIAYSAMRVYGIIIKDLEYYLENK